LQGIQVTESESHSDWRRDVVSPPGDVGGDFTTWKQVCYHSVGNVHLESGWLNWDAGNEYQIVYDGPLIIDEIRRPNIVSYPAPATGGSRLDKFGAEAIAKCAPTRPTINLAESLLDTIHDGLPKLIGRATWEERTSKALDLHSKAKTGAGEFLNYQFGWLPIVSDVVDFVKVIGRLDILLQQYARDNGNVVRRRFAFPPEISQNETVIASNVLPFCGVNTSGLFDFSKSPRGSVVRRRQTTVNRWFSGAFVYHLPKTFFQEIYTPFASDFQVYRKMLGMELTPSVLWELTPWSWAIDWFTNAGDVISNANMWANDGLVMKYGYVMEHTIVHDTYIYVGPTNFRKPSSARPPDLHLVTETKLRRKASPFGFGLTLDGLTTLQKSILAAVGISRSGR
jgi:hypothetical protein